MSVLGETLLLLVAGAYAGSYMLEKEQRENRLKPYEVQTTLPQTFALADGVQRNLRPYLKAGTPFFAQHAGVGAKTSAHIAGGTSYLDHSQNLNGNAIARGEKKHRHRSNDIQTRTRALNRLAQLPRSSPAYEYWSIVAANS